MRSLWKWRKGGSNKIKQIYTTIYQIEEITAVYYRLNNVLSKAKSKDGWKKNII